MSVSLEALYHFVELKLAAQGRNQKRIVRTLEMETLTHNPLIDWVGYRMGVTGRKEGTI